MKDPVDHVERPSAPWRTERLTECGLAPSDRSITRAQFYDRVMDQGQQRAAMSICMTCWHTAQNHAGGWGAATREQERQEFVDAWAYDPAAVLARDLARGRYARGNESRQRLNRELHVIALLIEAHRDEFDAAMVGLDEAPSMDELRAQRAARTPKERGKRL